MRWGSYGELPCEAGFAAARGRQAPLRPAGRRDAQPREEPHMSAWNAMTYEGKETILQVVRDEAERMFAMAEAPGAWEAPTACTECEARGDTGHIVDTTAGCY